jgi:geranylgeranyl reductase family protein
MDYDVIVVGAGPGGSTAARQCALSGMKTLLLEREKLPRYKTCGGGITSRAISLLDFKIKDDLIEGECYGVRVRYRNREMEIKTPFRITVLTSRDRFDMYLTEKAVDAGAELRDCERVTSLDLTNDCVTVKTEGNRYNASAVIGADGVNSAVSRYVRERFTPTEVALALEAEIPVSADKIGDPGMLSAYFGYTPRGYGWVFPKRDHLSVGIAGVLSGFRNPRGIFTNFLRRLNLDTHVKYHAHLIPFGGYNRTTSSDRILLVGDAAGFVDPIFGEGISYAINSGRIAADVLADAQERGDFSRWKLKEYDNLCYNAFGRYLKDALKISQHIHKHPGVFIKMIASNKPLLNKAISIPAGRTDYGEFRRWFLIRIPYYCIRSIFL